METMMPKLVAEDIPLLNSLLSDVFPGVEYKPAEMARLRAQIQKVCTDMFLTYGEKEQQGAQWVGKVGYYGYFILLLLVLKTGVFFVISDIE
jgi:dynein heavy chain 1